MIGALRKNEKISNLLKIHVHIVRYGKYFLVLSILK